MKIESLFKEAYVEFELEGSLRTVGKISSIEPDDQVLIIYGENNTVKRVNINNVYPLQISAGLLEKNGFVRYENALSEYWQGHGMLIEQFDDCFVLKTLTNSILLNVHTLQYFMMLCHAPKKIEL